MNFHVKFLEGKTVFKATVYHNIADEKTAQRQAEADKDLARADSYTLEAVDDAKAHELRLAEHTAAPVPRRIVEHRPETPPGEKPNMDHVRRADAANFARTRARMIG